MLNIVTNLHPSSRFNTSLTPPNLPGKCIVCGNSGGDGRIFVDFGFDIDFYGTVYWCSVCLIEPVNHLGWINPTQWTALNESNELLISRVQNLETENALLRAIAKSIYDLDNYLNGRDADSPLDKIKQRIESENSVSDGSTDLSERSDDSGSTEQINESGYADLSDFSLDSPADDSGEFNLI